MKMSLKKIEAAGAGSDSEEDKVVESSSEQVCDIDNARFQHLLPCYYLGR